MGLAPLPVPSSLRPPQTILDFTCRMRSNTEAWSRINRLVLVFVKIAAERTVLKPVIALKGVLELTAGTIDAFRVALPAAFFARGEFQSNKTSDTDRVINTADFYLGFIEAGSWIHTNASGLAEFARTIGTAFPLVGIVGSVNLSKLAFPAALVLFSALLYDETCKLRKAYQDYNLNQANPAAQQIHKKEMYKAALGIASHLGNITLTAAIMSAPVNPVVVTSLVALEVLTLLVSLSRNGFSVMNPEIK